MHVAIAVDEWDVVWQFQEEEDRLEAEQVERARKAHMEELRAQRAERRRVEKIRHDFPHCSQMTRANVRYYIERKC